MKFSFIQIIIRANKTLFWITYGRMVQATSATKEQFAIWVKKTLSKFSNLVNYHN